MTGVYRWQSPNTLDLQICVTAKQDLPKFELFMSSYFAKTFLASVYVTGPGGSNTDSRFEPVNRTPQAQGGYVMFPRNDEAVAMIRDGRWKIPPSPVDWNIGPPLAAPLAIRRDQTSGLTGVMMARPEDCFAVSSPWNPASPGAGGYRSLYLSLFGRDLAAGQTAQAHCRLILARQMTDELAVEYYRQFLKDSMDRSTGK